MINSISLSELSVTYNAKPKIKICLLYQYIRLTDAPALIRFRIDRNDRPSLPLCVRPAHLCISRANGNIVIKMNTINHQQIEVTPMTLRSLVQRSRSQDIFQKYIFELIWVVLLVVLQSWAQLVKLVETGHGHDQTTCGQKRRRHPRRLPVEFCV